MPAGMATTAAKAVAAANRRNRCTDDDTGIAPPAASYTGPQDMAGCAPRPPQARHNLVRRASRDGGETNPACRRFFGTKEVPVVLPHAILLMLLGLLCALFGFGILGSSPLAIVLGLSLLILAGAVLDVRPGPGDVAGHPRA